MRTPGRFESSSMRSALRDLLERENNLILTTIRDSKGQSTVGDVHGEAYGEYYAEVLGACNRHCDKHDAKTVEVLAKSAYSPNSPFAEQLVRDHGRQILPLMLLDARSDVSGLRREAIAMLGRIALSGQRLSKQDHAIIRNAVIEAATEPNSFMIRQAGVRALGEIGTSADRELLQRIVDRDSSPQVREDARRAIAAIARVNKR